MNQNAPVRLGIVGCGYIAELHAKAAEGVSTELKIVAATDVNPSTADRLVKKHGWESSYSSLAEMIRDAGLDGVIIATWPTSHLDMIRECVGAGIRYILCEKPFVITAEEALTAWELVHKTGVTVTEALMYRYHPAIARIEEILASGTLGALDHVRASFTYLNQDRRLPRVIDPQDPNRPWRYRAEAGGGALFDIGVYTINACTFCSASMPTRVAAFGRAKNEYGTNDRVIGLIEYANGTVGMIEASERADTTQELQISGEYGTLRLPHAWTIYDESEISLRRVISAPYRKAETVFRTLEDRLAIPKADSFCHQLLHLAKVVRGTATPKLSLAETIVNTITMDALARSLRDRVEVDISIPPVVAAAFTSATETRITELRAPVGAGTGW